VERGSSSLRIHHIANALDIDRDGSVHAADHRIWGSGGSCRWYLRQLVDDFIEKIDPGQNLSDEKTMVGAKAAKQNLVAMPAASCAVCPAPSSPGHGGPWFPAATHPTWRRPRHPHIRSDRTELDTRIFQHPVQPIHFPRTVLALMLAIPGQIPQVRLISPGVSRSNSG
jgi:hypothetical protein